MTSFSDLGLSARALAAVETLGYADPTPVQEQAIPSVLKGRDVIAAAKTGTGKTAAFCLPSMDRLDRARRGQGPLMLVVTPTRELAMQIEDVAKTVAKSTHHKVACLVGGVSYNPQIETLKRGCDVLIATPGRLIDLINQGAAHLNQVDILVLDEADRMLDMGFLPDMKRIVAACPDDRQTLLFSATIDAAIEGNMAHLLADPVFVEIAHKGEVADTIDQYIVRVDQRSKNDLLVALLNERGGTRIIVFARTRHRVDSTVRKLRRAGFKAEPIHSDRSQNQRKRALDSFAEGKCDILVATDVLARGIDVSDVNYVVNLDMPTQAEDYVHRVGRTGRAGEEGFAVSFVTPETEGELRDVQKLIGREIPTLEVKGFDPAASEEAIAARATRNAARRDPELSQAAKEQKARERKKKRSSASEILTLGEAQRQASKKQPVKTRGTAKGEDKKNQKRAQASRVNRKHAASASNSQEGGARRARPAGHGIQDASPGKDFRPGRSQRARRTQQHSRDAGRG